MNKPELDVNGLFGIPYPKVGTSKFRPVEGKGYEQIVGIEIEVENLDQDEDWYREELTKNFIIKIDNSLRGNALEFITVPLSIGQIIPEIDNFYAVTGFTEANFTDRCSIHVHANVTDFSQTQLAALCLLYQSVEEILFEFVGKDRDTNLYCIPWGQCRMNHRLIEDLFGNPINALKSWQKYTALNLLPIVRQGTVEFRHMHGTSDLNKIRTWVNLIGRLMLYAKTTSLDDVVKTITDLNTSSNYQAYFESLFGGVLPYTERYQQNLSRGVLDSKYSLMDFNHKEKKLPVKQVRITTDDLPQVAGGFTTDANIEAIFGQLEGTRQREADILQRDVAQAARDRMNQYAEIVRAQQRNAQADAIAGPTPLAQAQRAVPMPRTRAIGIQADPWAAAVDFRPAPRTLRTIR